jgi:hypothetical protein
MKRPTREEFQAVAEWLGIEITCWYEWSDVSLPGIGELGKTWQPHLPGIDSMRLMAALDAEIDTGQRNVAVRTPRGIKVLENHDSTSEGKLQALASAVWQCAVQVAMEAKR